MKDKELALNEARIMLDFVNNGISVTRDKAWKLSAFAVAITVYLMDGQGIVISVGSVIISSIILLKLRINFFPSDIAHPGTSPHMSRPVIKDGDYRFIDCMLDTYQDSIEQNREVLRQLTDKYLVSIRLFVLFLVLILFNPIKDAVSYFQTF